MLLAWHNWQPAAPVARGLPLGLSQNEVNDGLDELSGFFRHHLPGSGMCVRLWYDDSGGSHHTARCTKWANYSSRWIMEIVLLILNVIKTKQSKTKLDHSCIHKRPGVMSCRSQWSCIFSWVMGGMGFFSLFFRVPAYDWDKPQGNEVWAEVSVSDWKETLSLFWSIHTYYRYGSKGLYGENAFSGILSLLAEESKPEFISPKF